MKRVKILWADENMHIFCALWPWRTQLVSEFPDKCGCLLDCGFILVRLSQCCQCCTAGVESARQSAPLFPRQMSWVGSCASVFEQWSAGMQTELLQNAPNEAEIAPLLGWIISFQEASPFNSFLISNTGWNNVEGNFCDASSSLKSQMPSWLRVSGPAQTHRTDFSS